MLTGLPPFYNKDTNKMYEKIMMEEVHYPHIFSNEVKDLLSSLLQKDPKKRIQSVSDIKKH